jgi:hypothetical protein
VESVQKTSAFWTELTRKKLGNFCDIFDVIPHLESCIFGCKIPHLESYPQIIFGGESFSKLLRTHYWLAF